MQKFLIAVCATDHSTGRIKGTHHLSSHEAEEVADAKRAAISETINDWNVGDDGDEIVEDQLHVLFVMTVDESGEIVVVYYDDLA